MTIRPTRTDNIASGDLESMLSKLDTLNPRTRVLIEYLVCLAPDFVPIDFFKPKRDGHMLHRGPDQKYPHLEIVTGNPFEDIGQLYVAIEELSQVGLITKSDDLDSIAVYHERLKQAMLEELDHETRQIRFDWITFRLYDDLPQEGIMFTIWHDWTPYRKYLEALIRLYERWSLSVRPPIMMCEIMRSFAWNLIQAGSFSDAEDMTRQACKILEKALADGNHAGYSLDYIHLLMSHIYNNLGMIEYERNTRGHGVEALTKSDEIRRKVAEHNMDLISDHEVLADNVHNLLLARMANEDEGACDALIETLTAMQAEPSILGRRSRAVNLAIACRLTGRFEDSLSWCETARQDIDKKNLFRALVLYHMGCTLFAMGREEAARKTLVESMEIRMELAPEHCLTGYTYHRLAVLTRKCGELYTAAELFRSTITNLAACEA